MKRGDLIKSKQHIPEAEGPYIFLYELLPNSLGTSFCICISIDGSFSINIPKNNIEECGINILNSGTSVAHQLK